MCCLVPKSKLTSPVLPCRVEELNENACKIRFIATVQFPADAELVCPKANSSSNEHLNVSKASTFNVQRSTIASISVVSAAWSQQHQLSVRCMRPRRRARSMVTTWTLRHRLVASLWDHNGSSHHRIWSGGINTHNETEKWGILRLHKCWHIVTSILFLRPRPAPPPPPPPLICGSFMGSSSLANLTSQPSWTALNTSYRFIIIRQIVFTS